MIAALSSWHEQHQQAGAALNAVRALPAQVLLECYSVLTRLPAGLAVSAASAERVLASRFPGAPLSLPARQRTRLLATLAGAGVFGGAAYDGLVGLEARAGGETLLTLDERAQSTYLRLGIAFQSIER